MLLASLRITLVALGLSGIALTAGIVPNTPVMGDYHNGTTLICSDCHVMHGQQSHGYNPDGTGVFVPVGTTGPYTYLLRNEVNDLCLSCHDNSSFAPDVLDINTGKYIGEVRLAGFLNREGGVGEDATGHTLDTLDTAPGSSPAWKPEDDNGTGEGLNCVNCHHQHGYAGGQNTYRNLKMDPGNHGFLGAVVDYAVGTNDLGKDVYETAARSYDWADVDYNEPDTAASAYGNWCGGCHTNFHGAPGDANMGGTPDGSSFSHFVRHPVAGVDIGGAASGGHSNLGLFAGHTNHTKVMSASGVWDGSVGDVTPSCFSCHKSHGNGNAFGLIFLEGTGTVDENGDDGTTPKAICKQCHVQG
jgi:cytochrome c553